MKNSVFFSFLIFLCLFLSQAPAEESLGVQQKKELEDYKKAQLLELEKLFGPNAPKLPMKLDKEFMRQQIQNMNYETMVSQKQVMQQMESMSPAEKESRRREAEETLKKMTPEERKQMEKTFKEIFSQDPRKLEEAMKSMKNAPPPPPISNE